MKPEEKEPSGGKSKAEIATGALDEIDKYCYVVTKENPVPQRILKSDLDKWKEYGSPGSGTNMTITNLPNEK